MVHKFQIITPLGCMATVYSPSFARGDAEANHYAMMYADEGPVRVKYTAPRKPKLEVAK
jgi:hypothetical protein